MIESRGCEAGKKKEKKTVHKECQIAKKEKNEKLFSHSVKNGKYNIKSTTKEK